MDNREIITTGTDKGFVALEGTIAFPAAITLTASLVAGNETQGMGGREWARGERE